MRLTFADLSLATLKTIVHFTERGIVPAHWEKMQLAIAPNERQQIEQITSYLLNYQLTLMNEATIWSRAIYPLLLLAEVDSIQAWAQITLRATYPRFTLEGLVDGVLGHVLGGMIDAPYLIVIEAKRGLEAQNPQAQLYGTMLAAAWQNQQRLAKAQQEIYGCYTIGDKWTFVLLSGVNSMTAKQRSQDGMKAIPIGPQPSRRLNAGCALSTDYFNGALLARSAQASSNALITRATPDSRTAWFASLDRFHFS